MEDRPDTGHVSAFEEIAYLARSEHRSAVLDRLGDGQFEPNELVELTGASRPTVGRILGELEDRGWAERSGGGYVATPAGKAITSEFKPFREAVEAILRLGDAVDWLPRKEFPIELRHFKTATVQALGEDDPVKALEFVTELLRDASTWRVLTNLMAPSKKREAMLQGVRAGRLESVNVLTGEVLDRLLADPEREAWLRNYVDAGATVGRYDGAIPCNLFVIDSLVLIGVSQPDSEDPYTAIVSDNEVVRSWAVDVIDNLLANSNRITMERFDDEFAGDVEEAIDR